jgi:predicted transposase YbfD/YdcC
LVELYNCYIFSNSIFIQKFFLKKRVNFKQEFYWTIEMEIEKDSKPVEIKNQLNRNLSNQTVMLSRSPSQNSKAFENWVSKFEI